MDEKKKVNAEELSDDMLDEATGGAVYFYIDPDGNTALSFDTPEEEKAFWDKYDKFHGFV